MTSITNLVKTLGRKVLPFVLIAPLSLLFACNSDNDENIIHEKLPDAEPIELRLMEKVESDNSFALDLFKTT